MKFRKKPVVIDAVLWRGLVEEIIEWDQSFMPRSGLTFNLGAVINIPTLEGEMTCQKGDWIIRGIKGEFYPCKPDVFEKSYEPAE